MNLRKVLLTAFFSFPMLMVQHIAASADPNVELHRKWVEEKNADGWYPAKSTKGSFSIVSPIPFNDYTITANDPNIGLLTIHGIGSKNNDGYEFGALETERADKGSELDLQPIVENIAKKLDAPLPDIVFQQVGEEKLGFAELRGKNRSVMMRISSTPHSIFNVMCDFPTIQENTAKDLCAEYISSFRID